MIPDEIYRRLYEKASTRKRKTLTLINDVCRKQHEAEIKDFSFGTIARLIEPYGGPTEQALRNKNAGEYRALIREWAEYSNTTTKKPKKQKEMTLNDEILSRISDPTTKALVGMIVSENKKLKRENSLLKEQTTFNIDMRPEIISSNTKDSVIIEHFTLTETETNALKYAISDQFVSGMGWTKEDGGGINKDGYPIYKVGYVTAINKILDEMRIDN